MLRSQGKFIGHSWLTKLGPGGITFFVATGIASVSNFLFHVVVSRRLGPSGYGGLSSLLNLMLILTVPIGALQVSVTRAAPGWFRRGVLPEELRRIFVRAALVSLVGAALLAALSPILAGYLHLGSPGGVVLVAVWLIPAVLGGLLQGVLMGERKFTTVAIANLLGAGLGRLILGAVLVSLGLGLVGAVLASLLGQVITAAISAGPYALRMLQRPSFGRAEGLGSRETILSVGSLASYWVLASMDVVLARHLLPPRISGFYAAAATTGRIALFLPGAIASIALPRFATGNGRSEEARDTLRWALGATGAISGLGALVLIAVPRFVVSILFGSEFLGAAPTVRILGLEAAGLAVVGLLIYFHIASKSLYALVPLVGVASALCLIYAFHSSSNEIALWMLLSVSGTAVVMFIMAANQLLREPVMHQAIGPECLGVLERREGDKELTVVVPFYNPGSNLTRHVREIIALLDSTERPFEIIAVSDGSTDGSAATLKDVDRADVLQVIEMPRNYGKGEALRAGLVHGRGKYLGFIDSDGDIPATELLRLIDSLGDDSADIVAGSKRHPNSDVVYPPLRRVYSWGYQQLVRVLFNLSVRDTQTGIKFIRREVLAEVLPRMVEKRFAFDLELFVVARRMGYTKVLEVPVRILTRFGSTVSLKSVFAMLLDTMGIFYRLRVLGYYDAERVTFLRPTVSPLDA